MGRYRRTGWASVTAQGEEGSSISQRISEALTLSGQIRTRLPVPIRISLDGRHNERHCKTAVSLPMAQITCALPCRFQGLFL